MIELLAALPGIAAIGIGIARWRAWRYPERGWRRSSPRARLVLFAAFALAIGACHSIDSNVYAHAPVPITRLPLNEPLIYSNGTRVPSQNGLLASYFAGANYERLDHQQIDPNVNFVWDATGNPVISAPDGIDHNDGDFRLPDSWGIWSVVWEGYLEAPTADTYGLRIHVNNGGWLEMKDSTGALAVVIDCAGGTSFEGDCDAGAVLAQGRNYVRMSYFNNAPPSADAFLSWRPPGAADFSVIPTESLFTNLEAANTPPTVRVGDLAPIFADDVLSSLSFFVDPDSGQTWSATVDYGEGSGSSALALDGHRFTLNHLYLRPGTFTVTVAVIDSLGATGSAQSNIFVKRRPLIFLPGIFGSELAVDASGTARGVPDGRGGTNDISYPGCGTPFTTPAIWLNLCEAAKPGRDDFFDVLKYDPNTGNALVPAIHPNGRMLKGPLTDRMPENRTGYEDIEGFFQEATHDGYVLGDDLIVFTYDWRAHVDAAASTLNARIAEVRARTGAPKVDLVAHSQGGLVVKSFLLTGSERDHLDQVVLLGSPLLGTPLVTYGLLGGTCIPVFQSGIRCLIDPDEVADVSRSVPSTMDLVPTATFYALVRDLSLPSPYVDRRISVPDAPPNDDYNAFLARAREAGIPDHYLNESQTLHANDAMWLTQIPTAAHVTLVAGSNLSTPGQVIERRTVEFVQTVDPISGQTITRVRLSDTVDIRYVDGDEYVPTQSASLNQLGTPPANVRAIYARLKHVQLPLHEGLPITLAILRGLDPITLGLAQSTPFRPTGVLIDTHSPVDLLVTDAQGHRTGFEGESGFGEIPGANLNRIGGAQFISVPAGASYTARIKGLAVGESLVRVRTTGDATGQFVYAHVLVTATSVATFTVNAQGVPGELQVDLDGDGRPDRTIMPVALSGAAADDFDPPVLRIASPDGRATVGTIAATWAASDAVSGLAQSFAVLDRSASGGTLLPSPGPILVSPGSHTFEVFAEDRAGNLATRSVSFASYAGQFLVPLTANGRYVDQAGRTIPVRFAVRRADGSLVEDASVNVTLLDDTGAVAAGPLVASQNPASGVVFENAVGYHGNLSTKGLTPGSYTLRVRFDSPSLVGDLLLGLDLR